MAATIEKFKQVLLKISRSSWKTDDKTPIVSAAKNKDLKNRQQALEHTTGISLNALNTFPSADANKLQGNIENYIGMAQTPVGIAGPVLIKGQHASGVFHIPMATTEGALVASYSRGAKACSENGGVQTHYIAEGVQRSPIFIFETSELGLEFLNWFNLQMDSFSEIVQGQSRFAKLQKVVPLLEGNQLILTFHFSTGDAAGQNMVTICTQAICEFILQNSPTKIKRWYLESNYGGDKKATHNALNGVRGRKVIAEVCIRKEVVAKILKSSPHAMTQYFQTHLTASILSGAIGAQGHYANGMAALFLATGQDVACVAEAAIGMTRIEMTEEGDLYASVTLPNLIVGTLGGGTHLSTASTCLELLDCKGAGKARKFAEIVAATVLCGELSITAALAEGHFAKAHQELGRPAGGRRL